MKEQVTTIKVRRQTVELLKMLAARRGRRESMEQVVLELIEQYVKSNYEK